MEKMSIAISVTDKVGYAEITTHSGGLGNVEWAGDVISIKAIGISRDELSQALNEIDDKIKESTR